MMGGMKPRHVAPVMAVAIALAGCTNANDSAPRPEEEGVTRASSCSYPLAGEPAKPVDPPSENDVVNTGEAKVTLHMTAGDVEITMDRATAPCTVNSFVSLAQQGWLDETSCHRLVDHGIFVLQCGDPTGTGTGGPGYSIPDELSPNVTSLEKLDGDKVNYPPGTVAVANSGPETGGSQWFIVWDDSPLPPHYTVFGTVDEAGLEVVRGIAAQGVDAADRITPIAEARITSVTLG